MFKSPKLQVFSKQTLIFSEHFRSIKMCRHDLFAEKISFLPEYTFCYAMYQAIHKGFFSFGQWNQYGVIAFIRIQQYIIYWWIAGHCTAAVQRKTIDILCFLYMPVVKYLWIIELNKVNRFHFEIFLLM